MANESIQQDLSTILEFPGWNGMPLQWSTWRIAYLFSRQVFLWFKILNYFWYFFQQMGLLAQLQRGKQEELLLFAMVFAPVRMQQATKERERNIGIT